MILARLAPLLTLGILLRDATLISGHHQNSAARNFIGEWTFVEAQTFCD